MSKTDDTLTPCERQALESFNRLHAALLPMFENDDDLLADPVSPDLAAVIAAGLVKAAAMIEVAEQLGDIHGRIDDLRSSA